MSEPKRYNFSATIVHHIDGETTAAIKYHTEPDGLFVSYEDYARLKAEVERLTKAGDAMAEQVALVKRQDEGSRFDPIEMHYDHELIVKWLAAKEGKQP